MYFVINYVEGEKFKTFNSQKELKNFILLRHDMKEKLASGSIVIIRGREVMPEFVETKSVDIKL